VEDLVKGVVQEYVCKHNVVLDIGSGSGGSIKMVTDSCDLNTYVVGIDKDCEKLLRAKGFLKGFITDLICCDASTLPFRDLSIPTSTMSLTLHEINEKLVDSVLNEVWRVLKAGGKLLFIDKILFKASSPSEGLTALTEEAFHKVMEYVTGIKPYGLKGPEECLSRLVTHGFKPLLTNTAMGKYVDGGSFLRNWGKDTLRLLNEIRDEARREECTKLIQRIRKIGVKHGYGPARFIVAVLSKAL